MRLSGRRPRTVLGEVHVALATVLGIYFYWPLAGAEPFDLLMQAVVFPGFVVTGVWMTQQARIRRLIAGGRRVSSGGSRHGHP